MLDVELQLADPAPDAPLPDATLPNATLPNAPLPNAPLPNATLPNAFAGDLCVPTDASRLSVSRLDSLDALAQWAAAWNRSSEDVPFRSYEWASCWWRHYAPAHGELFVLAVQDAQQKLVGLAPWYRSRSAGWGQTLQLLGSGEVCSDYLSLICREQDARGVRRGLGRVSHGQSAAPLARVGHAGDRRRRCCPGTSARAARAAGACGRLPQRSPLLAPGSAGDVERISGRLFEVAPRSDPVLVAPSRRVGQGEAAAGGGWRVAGAGVRHFRRTASEAAGHAGAAGLLCVGAVRSFSPRTGPAVSRFGPAAAGVAGVRGAAAGGGVRLRRRRHRVLLPGRVRARAGRLVPRHADAGRFAASGHRRRPPAVRLPPRRRTVQAAVERPERAAGESADCRRQSRGADAALGLANARVGQALDSPALVAGAGQAPPPAREESHA